MTHAELVLRAARWLRVTKRCAPVLQEIGSASEAPDAIGWRSAFSILVECKASWSDFQRDHQKYFRRDSSRGMGRDRYYCAPPELGHRIAEWLEKDGDPYWGVVVPRGRGMLVIRKASPFGTRNMINEQILLVSALRRATESWGRKVFGEIAPPLVDGDPYPTTARVIADLRKELRKSRDDISRMVARSRVLEAEIDGLVAANNILTEKLRRAETPPDPMPFG